MTILKSREAKLHLLHQTTIQCKNQRVLKAGEEVDGINCDLADFLSGMTLDPSEPVCICVDAGESMKRHQQYFGGQYCTQGDRSMTATNVSLEGMKNDAASARLTEVAEVVE
jgi:hypothetical protein